MSKLYLPLRIAQQMSETQRQKEAELGDQILENAELQQFANSILHPDKEIENPSPISKLNLDDFLSWIVGSTFCKRKYNGTYAEFNKRLLEVYEEYEQKGQSYKTTRKHFRNSLTFATVFRCWEQYKQAYRFDADFVDELMQTDSIEIPIQVLKRLPFRCFYLDLEDVERFYPFIGVFAYIGFDEKNGLPNLAIYRVTNPQTEDSQVPIYPSYASGPDMQKWGVLFKNNSDEICIRFTNNKEKLSQLPNQKDIEVFDMVMFTLQAMLYLSSNKPDTMASPKRKYVNTGKRHAQQSSFVNLEITDVGVRYGTAIRKMKKEQKETTDEPIIVEVKNRKPRKPMSSHVRSAHWHHYWVGKGRSELAIRWVPPTFVSGIGKEMPVTIHNVKK